MNRKVGIIGLGIMGMPMARNLIKAGFEVTAYNARHPRSNRLPLKGRLKQVPQRGSS